MSLITLDKLRRFYNRIKALIDLLDERIEESELQIVDTVNDVSTLSSDLTKHQNSNNILLKDNAKKNYLPCQYNIGYTGTSYSVNIVFNEDYSITMNGTPTGWLGFDLAPTPVLLSRVLIFYLVV